MYNTPSEVGGSVLGVTALPASTPTTQSVELDKLSEWFKSNILSLNITITNYILFSPKSKCRQQLINSFTIQIDGKTVDPVENARFLGVYIDEKLQWNVANSNQISAKVSKNIGT